jgi:hypothetical protein
MSGGQLVRHFRQILLWPLQLAPIRAGAQIQAHWEVLERAGSDNPWGEMRDEFRGGSASFQQRHYSEFVTFLPYVRRFLYGDAKGRTGGACESPIRVFRRSDVAKLRVTFPGRTAEPIVFGVAHVDLCFFYDLDVVVLVVEIFGDDIPLQLAQDTMYRFGRAYPTYWHDDGGGGHCLERVEWLSAAGDVLATSDYEQKERYLAFVGEHRAPCYASHWRYLLLPLVPDYSAEKGAIRYRQVEYGRMPLLAYLAMDDVRALTRGDFVRLGLVTAPGASQSLPYAASYIADFESRFCYDQYWNESREGRPGSRTMCCGHALAMVGDAHDPFFVDRDGGLLGQFRHQYFLLFLIPHIHKASLLMLGDRMADALNRLDIHDMESVKDFKRSIRQLLEIFLRFTHRYWFHEISEQPQARELFRMTQKSLNNDRLYNELRAEIGDMDTYLDSDALRRQASTVMRLTVVTSFGLIGTIVTGFLGMNLIAAAEASLSDKILYFAMVAIPVTLLTFFTLLKSQRLSDFLDALSDERVSARGKLNAFVAVWKGKRRARE